MVIFDLVKSIGWFLLKVLFVEFCVDAAKYVAHILRHNKLPEHLLKSYSNKFSYYAVNGFETGAVMLLVYYDVQLWVIVPTILVGSSLVEHVSTYFFERT